MTENTIIRIKTDGCTSEEFKFKPNSINIDELELKDLMNSKKKDKTKLSRECDFEWDDKVLTVYAKDKGKHGTENKTELPPPLDTQLYFGNIFVIAHKDNKLVNLSLEEYSEFYNSAFGGFEDLDKEESLSDEEEPNSEDEAFIVNDVNDDNDEDSDYVVESEEDDTESTSDNTNEEIELEKWNKIEEYLNAIDPELLNAPDKFKEVLYNLLVSKDELSQWLDENSSNETNAVWKKWVEDNV
jgi:hypothetical protein